MAPPAVLYLGRDVASTPSRMWVATQLFFKNDEIESVETLGMWSNVADATAYIYNRNDMDAALITHVVHNGLTGETRPVWQWTHDGSYCKIVSLTSIEINLVQR